MQRKTIEALRDLNQERHARLGDPEINSRIAAYELAFRMQSAAPELIDLASEPKATRDLYGLERTEPKIKASRGGGHGEFHAFAANCLLARRLIERGVRFVNLFHASWDHHSNLDAELGHNCLMADQPVAALLKDLKRRGLLDTTLVLWISEFGRTPLGENRVGYKTVTGRDHHPFAFTIWMAGGGVKGGQSHRQDRRHRLERRRGSRPRQRFARHDPAPVRAESSAADVSLPGPRLPPDGRGRQGGDEIAGVKDEIAASVGLAGGLDVQGIFPQSKGIALSFQAEVAVKDRAIGASPRGSGLPRNRSCDGLESER